MAKIGLPKGCGKRLKVREKSGNFEMDIEWQPCDSLRVNYNTTAWYKNFSLVDTASSWERNS